MRTECTLQLRYISSLQSFISHYKTTLFGRVHIFVLQNKTSLLLFCTHTVISKLEHCTKSQWRYLPNCTWSVVLRPLFSFLLNKRPQITLLRVDCWKDIFYLPFGKRARILITGLCARRFIFRFGSFDIIEFKWGRALMSIFCGDTLIDNAVSQINVFVSAP